jgi:G protein-coupled receptor Mth (Methuselah protein)
MEVNVYEKGFCLENFYLPENGDIYLSGFLCQNAVSIQKLNSSVDSNDYEVHNENFTENSYFLNLRVIYTVCGLLSLFFLFLTVFLYQRLPELNNFQGEITTIYLLSISLTTFLLTLSYNVRLKDEEEDLEYFIDASKNNCIILGYSIYFSAILMFCWMSALSFDLYWSFSCTSVPLRDENYKLKKVCYYFFGFGTPIIMTSSIILLDLTKNREESSIFVPGVGEDRCFLSFQGARYFFYVPVFVLLCVNLMFYLTTLVSLCKSYRSTHMASRQRRNPRIEVGRYKFYLLCVFLFIYKK